MADVLIEAREPQRERGRIRVAAIMQAGIEVFTERGYDAATMTEIAARSNTAIASLYRFFPSKEVLADALPLNCAQQRCRASRPCGSEPPACRWRPPQTP